MGLYSTTKQDLMAETKIWMTAEHNSLHVYLGSITLFQVIQEKWYQVRTLKDPLFTYFETGTNYFLLYIFDVMQK